MKKTASKISVLTFSLNTLIDQNNPVLKLDPHIKNIVVDNICKAFKTMKVTTVYIVVVTTLWSCAGKDAGIKPAHNPLAGTWRLISGTVVEKGDTVVTDYTKNVSFVKIMNDTHFAFLQHDLNKGKDSAVFVSGGGSYSLNGSSYTEHLEYCSARDWEGNDFKFTVNIKNDTLTQSGVEKVESTGVNRMNTEKYVRVKK